MAPSPKPDHHLNLNYLPQLSANQSKSGSSTANTSPIEAPTNNPMRSPFGNPGGMNGLGSAPGTGRLGAGSPSHELGGRLYSKRAREIQAQEGLTPVWGPPASGGSTPLRETIPESPSQDGFPDFIPPSESNILSPTRRARAGTVPSRCPPSGGSSLTGPTNSQNRNSRPSPATSPFKPSSFTSTDTKDAGINRPAKTPTILTTKDTSALLSRLRAGSMPQRSNLADSSSPFGSSLFSTSWGGPRERASTMTSIRSDPPESPAQSLFSKDGLNDTDVKTLDYLGLADTPAQSQASVVNSGFKVSIPASLAPYLSMKTNPNRIRSYSVNAKEKYESEEDGQYLDEESQTAAMYAQTQYAIHQHNLAVQAYANSAMGNRPRARTTAGVLDSPARSAGLGYMKSPLEQSVTAASLGFTNGMEYAGLPEAVQALQLGATSARSNFESSDDNNQDGPTRALWLGGVPVSTTISSLQAIFQTYGKIESVRVLTHKNCGFINYENIESAIQARSNLNGKEIFPGAGPMRINYAKAPYSDAGTPGNNTSYMSRSPDTYSNGQVEHQASQSRDNTNGNRQANGVHAQTAAAAMQVPSLAELRSDMLEILPQLGATDHDCYNIATSIDTAIALTDLASDISPIPEASQNRIHDAPKLRDIRKRIDNNTVSAVEIEEVAMAMLPEIAELGSDYLGNTVVQKLFELCSEEVKYEMLLRIEPHLAEMGAHKNGTWAAQKIIEAAREPAQINLIVNGLRRYVVPLFLDQYGNYVLQCCLKFGSPYNSFLFETMIARMWDIAQGRFGARAIRACLESHLAHKDHLRMLAASIALHSVQLATNANGALLLTWYLDTCTFPRRRAVLAPRLIPHLVHLCTHRVAHLTVLKVVNQRNEPEARDMLGKALFFSEDHKVLEDILSDQTSGTTLIYKILTTPYFEENVRQDIVANVKTVLTRLQVSASQGYKRLMDEVGMTGRGGRIDRDRQGPNGHGSHQDRSRPSSSHNMHNGRRHHQDGDRYTNGQSYPNSAQRSAFPSPAMMPGNSGMDHSLAGYDPFSPSYMATPLSAQYANVPFNGVSRGMSPGFYPNLPNYVTASPQFEPMGFRGMQPQPQRPMQLSSDALMQGQAFSPNQFSAMGQPGMPFSPMGFMAPQPQHQQLQQQQMQQIQQQQIAMNQQQNMRFQNGVQNGARNGTQNGGPQGGQNGQNGGQNGYGR